LVILNDLEFLPKYGPEWPHLKAILETVNQQIVSGRVGSYTMEYFDIGSSQSSNEPMSFLCPWTAKLASEKGTDSFRRPFKAILSAYAKSPDSFPQQRLHTTQIDVPGGTLLQTEPPNKHSDIDPSLLELPTGRRDIAIEAFLNRRSRPPLPSLPTLNNYNPARSNVKDFNKEFPLGSIYKRWRQGIPIWAKTKHLAFVRPHTSELQERVITDLLKTGISKRFYLRLFLGG